MLLRPTDRVLPSLLCPHLWRILILAAALSKCHGVIECTERTSYTQCIERINGLVMNEPGVQNCNEVKSVAAGDTEMLDCQVQNDVEVIFNGWNFYPSNGGSMVPDVQNDTRVTAETDRLTITDIRPEDEGLYACRASEDGAPEGTVTAGCIIVHATARGYTDTTVRIEAGSNEEVTLPTAVVFEKAGSCGITPEITEARLRYEPDMNILFHCMTRDCVVNNQTRYEFLTFGDVTLVPPDVLPGQYLMALIQMCPDLILRMTYNVIFTNGPGCPGLSSPAHGNVTLVQTLTNLVAIFSCDSGFALVGKSFLTCGTAGVWTGTVPVCESGSCDSCCPEPVCPSATPTCPNPTDPTHLPAPGILTCPIIDAIGNPENIVNVRRPMCGVLEWDVPSGSSEGLTYKIRFYSGQSFSTTPASLRVVLPSTTNSLRFTADDIPTGRPLYAIVKARNRNGVHSPKWSTPITAAMMGCP